MSVGEICNREVIIVHRDETVQEAAKLMRQHHVGDVVVVDDRNGVRVPVGIVTDRDVVVEIVATELDQATMTVGDIMAQELFTVKEGAVFLSRFNICAAKLSDVCQLSMMMAVW